MKSPLIKTALVAVVVVVILNLVSGFLPSSVAKYVGNQNNGS